MKRALLTRTETGDEGTFGTLKVYNEAGTLVYNCRSLELPWRENRRGLSCAPTGRFLFRKRTDSPKHGTVYEEWDDPGTPQREDVPDRDCIQIHAANLAGDESKGYVKQLDGCIATGKTVALFRAGVKPAGALDQRGVTESAAALAEMIRELNWETFELAIEWAPGVGPKAAAA
jgi:hypothetical protein